MGVDHGGDEGDASSLRPKRGDGLYNHPPYKGDEQMKSILHNTQIITPEEIVSYIDDEIIFSRKFELGCRWRPRDLIFSQFSIDCCQNLFASGTLPGPRWGGGLQRPPNPQLNLAGSHTDTPLHPPFNHNKSTRLGDCVKSNAYSPMSHWYKLFLQTAAP